MFDKDGNIEDTVEMFREVEDAIGAVSGYLRYDSSGFRYSDILMFRFIKFLYHILLMRVQKHYVNQLLSDRR